MQSRRARHTFRVADGRAGDPAPSTVWCAGHACACGTMRASACATAEGAVVSTKSASPHRSPVGGGRGRGCRITRLGRRTERVLSSCTLGRGVLAEGEMSGRIPHGRSRAGGGLGAVLGACRGVGGDARGAVAVSLAREDHTTTPRWRARARIVLFSRERPVSRIGQKKGKSTTCEPSVLRRRQERLVAPNLWPSPSVHVAASPGSHGAPEVGGLSVHSFRKETGASV